MKRLYHRDDPATSVQSAAERLAGMPERLDRIMKILRQNPGKTAGELAWHADFGHCSCCARFEINRLMKVLVEKGLAVAGPSRSCRRIGAKCLTYTASAPGGP